MFPRSAADRQKVNSWKADEVFGEDAAHNLTIITFWQPCQHEHCIHLTSPV